MYIATNISIYYGQLLQSHTADLPQTYCSQKLSTVLDSTLVNFALPLNVVWYIVLSYQLKIISVPLYAIISE